MRPRAEDRLRALRAPDEAGAEERAWKLIRTAYLEREPAPRQRSRRRLAVAPILAVIAVGLILSPAGARVGQIISRALGVRHAAATLSSLPSPGRVLLSGAGGTWTAAADGSARRLGAWSQASWSPHGLYVAAVGGGRLAAVDGHGSIHWAIARPAIADPRWYSPSGYRIAYRSAGTLRVIAGDGTADHLIARHAGPVAPAWRPGLASGPFQLAYVTDRGKLVLRDGDSDQILWTRPPGAPPRELIWSSDGQRLLVISAHAVRTYAANGTRGITTALPHAAITDASLAPDGRTVALVLNHDQVVVEPSGSRHPAMRSLLAGSGVREVSWSPDGRWLLVAWPAANQWVFLRVAGAPHVAAVSRIAQQFSSTQAFPRLDGWCCTARGPAG